MDLVVGLGDLVISKSREDRLMTFALASCIGVTAYHPSQKVAGMIHVVLPSPFSQEIINDYPESYFATVGVPRFFEKLTYQFGCPIHELVVKVYGGADPATHMDVFEIGRRNTEAVIPLLNQLGAKIHVIDVGGGQSRTLYLHADSGKVDVTYKKMLQPELPVK